MGDRKKGLQTCLRDASCQNSLRNAIVASLTPDVAVADLGSLLALFSETVVQGAFSPSVLSLENKVILDYQNDLEMGIFSLLEKAMLKSFGRCSQ